MNISLDISKNINILLQICSCNNCNTLNEEQYSLSICNHQICRECLFDNNSQNKMKCPICDRICKSTDIKKDALKESGIKILKAMLKHITCIDGSNILNFTIKLYEDVVRNHLGETPLHIASKRGNFMTLMVLLQSNINLDSKDNAGWTALHDAVISNQKSCVNALLMAGASVNVTGLNYKTPLHLATEILNKSMVELLLLYGADPYSLNYDGSAPIDMVTTDIAKWMQAKRKKVIMPTVYIPSEINLFSTIELNTDICNNNIKFITYTNYMYLSNITHLLVDENKEIDLVYLIALLRGCFIVTKEFLSERIEKNWVYQTLKYIQQNKKEIILRSVENRLYQRPKLFHKMYFFVVDYKESHVINGMEFNKKDLTRLIDEGDGTVLRREPALRIAGYVTKYPYHLKNCLTLKRCSYYIIYMEKYKPELCYNMIELRHKSSEWLINSILNFNIVDN